MFPTGPMANVWGSKNLPNQNFVVKPVAQGNPFNMQQIEAARRGQGFQRGRPQPPPHALHQAPLAGSMSGYSAVDPYTLHRQQQQAMAGVAPGGTGWVR